MLMLQLQLLIKINRNMSEVIKNVRNKQTGH